MNKADQIMKCTVCGEPPTEEIMAIQYQGSLHTFCCPYCRARFVEDCEAEFIQKSSAASRAET